MINLKLFFSIPERMLPWQPIVCLTHRTEFLSFGDVHKMDIAYERSTAVLAAERRLEQRMGVNECRWVQ